MENKQLEQEHLEAIKKGQGEDSTTLSERNCASITIEHMKGYGIWRTGVLPPRGKDIIRRNAGDKGKTEEELIQLYFDNLNK